MQFKKKFLILSALALLLALVYILSFVFDSQNRNKHSFSWLAPSTLDLADRIEIYGSPGMTVLNRKNGVWVIPAGAVDYPVKQGRVEDLLGLLSRKAVYPLRKVSAKDRDDLLLGEGNASRILIRGGVGLPLLDLLVGAPDVFGRDVYLKRADRNETYSGEDYFSLYTEGRKESWYDLRFFPATGAAGMMAYSAVVDDVQQVDVILEQHSYTLRRSGRAWIIAGNESVELDTVRVESWLRSILEGEGEAFASASPTELEASLTLHFGNGGARNLRIGVADEERRRTVIVSTSPLYYIISEWAFNRFIRDSSYFLRDG